MHSSVARAHALGLMFLVRIAGNSHRRDESFNDPHTSSSSSFMNFSYIKLILYDFWGGRI